MSKEKLIYGDLQIDCTLNSPFEFSCNSASLHYLYTMKSTYQVLWKSNKIVKAEMEPTDFRTFDTTNRRVLTAMILPN